MIEHRPTSESKFLFNNKDLRDLSPEMPTKFNSDFYNRSSLPLNIRNQTQNQNPHSERFIDLLELTKTQVTFKKL